MTAIPRDARDEHSRITRELIASAIEVHHSSDRVVIQLAPDQYEKTVRFIALERLCCSFLRFTLDVATDRGGLSLTISGPSGAGEFIRAELHLPG
jgi:hypothetical protein